MLAAHDPKLKAAITAVNGWRTAATTAGVELRQVNLKFPDGSPVVLAWDDDATDWQVST